MQAGELISTEPIDNQADTVSDIFTMPNLKSDRDEKKFQNGTASSEVEEKSKVVFLNVQKHKRTREKELQWWIGKITEVKENCFKAVLEDLNGRIHLVEFDDDFVSQGERDLLFVGSRFTYSVSVLDMGVGSTQYKTKLSFDYRRRWLEKYDNNVQRVAEEIFPESLLDL